VFFSCDSISTAYQLPQLIEVPKLKLDEKSDLNQLDLTSELPIKMLGISRKKDENETRVEKVKSINGVLDISAVPESFPIKKDNTYAPLAQPTPSSKLVKFGGMDDDLSLLDFSSELKKAV
jgi:hypothetical protein